MKESDFVLVDVFNTNDPSSCTIYNKRTNRDLTIEDNRIAREVARKMLKSGVPMVSIEKVKQLILANPSISRGERRIAGGEEDGKFSDGP
jgi:hypothetical protein